MPMDEIQDEISSMKNTCEDEWLVKDGKRLSGSGYPVIEFFFYFAFILPVVAFVLVPIALLSYVLSKLWVLIFGRQKSESSSEPQERSDSDINCDPGPPRSEREYDLILYGATGFTGKMAAKYINKVCTKNFRWAIAGRSERKLKEVATSIGISELPIIIADSAKQSTLDAMVRKTKCVITSAGPFDLYGSGVVAACAYAGTHYCDITGESDWVRKMIDKYDGIARESGAKIVSFCGHDCVPWDLSVLVSAERINEVSMNINGKPEALKSILCFDEIRSSPSGGTLATVYHSILDRVRVKTSLGFDPLLKTLQGGKSGCKLRIKNRLFPGFSHSHWVGGFVMASVMANCVRRSNALLEYSADKKKNTNENVTSTMTYNESLIYPGFMRLFITNLQLFIFGLSFFFPPLLFFLQYILPKPGQGPSKQTMDRGFLRVSVYATGSRGTKVKTTIYFPTDPGYRDTARMLVESGMCLALDDEFERIQKFCPTGGIFTPAPCLGRVLLQRLLATGTKINIRSI